MLYKLTSNKCKTVLHNKKQVNNALRSRDTNDYKVQNDNKHRFETHDNHPHCLQHINMIQDHHSVQQDAALVTNDVKEGY